MWRILSEQWVIPLGDNNKLGFVQLMWLVSFIVGGFLISSLIHKFVLSKLFDILRTEPGLQNTISRLLHYLIIAIAILLGFISIHLEHLILVIGGSLGIILGLALKDVVADLVAGFFVLLERPIEIGNYIQLDNHEGTVHKIAARTTTIVNGRNFTVVIPNKDLLAKQIINWGHGRFAIGVEVQLKVDHQTDPELVKKLLALAIQGNPVVLKVPAPAIRLAEIEEHALFFFVRVFISARRAKEHNEIASQLRFAIFKIFKENNINITVAIPCLHYPTQKHLSFLARAKLTALKKT
jgi:small-conductance mechanosensitive channel